MSRKKGEGQTPFLLAAAPLGDGTPHPGRSDFRPENLRNAGPEEKVPREVCPSPPQRHGAPVRGLALACAPVHVLPEPPPPVEGPLLHPGANAIVVETSDTLARKIRDRFSHFLALPPVGLLGPLRQLKS